jgi:hypothetical protein
MKRHVAGYLQRILVGKICCPTANAKPRKEERISQTDSSIGHECKGLGSYAMAGLNTRWVQPPSSAFHTLSFRRPVFVPCATLNGLLS